jgi:hypothetical protein
MKVETDIRSIAAYPLGRAVFLVIMNVDIFKTNVIIL